MSFRRALAGVRAGLLQQGWVACSTPGCDKLVAPIEGETGPVTCAACAMKHTHKRNEAGATWEK